MNDSFALLLNPFRICGSFAISSINRFCCSSRWDPKWDALWWLWSIWWTQIIPNPRSLCYLIAVHLTKHHSETQKHKARSLKRGRSREIPSDKGLEILDLFFHFGKGGDKTLLKHFLKMVMEMRNDADGCLKTNVWKDLKSYCAWLQMIQKLNSYQQFLCCFSLLCLWSL